MIVIERCCRFWKLNATLFTLTARKSWRYPSVQKLKVGAVLVIDVESGATLTAFGRHSSRVAAVDLRAAAVTGCGVPT